LYDKSYQQLLANGIANGVDSYFSKNPWFHLLNQLVYF
jgi:N-acetylmuramoyl-L-alanine amidase